MDVLSMKNNHFLVIMAGGVGARFWPMSRTVKPKQFIDILGTGKTLIQSTYSRFSSFIPDSNIFVVTSEEYADLVKEQLPSLPENQILLEPTRRNTAPCIAYANARIQQLNPDATIIVAPSDHLITKEEEFARIVKEGLEFVANHDVLLTIGIKPTRPETGYGYIQVKESKPGYGIQKVKTFTEKPNLDMARVFVESGEFFWNSGIFIWSLREIQKSFATNLSDIDVLFKKGSEVMGTAGERNFIRASYADCRSISIDYGIMEKADNVYVFTADLGWSDLGTWGSLYEHSEQDQHRNVLFGEAIISQRNKGCIIHASNDKLMVVRGLSDYLVIDSDNCLLILPKSEEQSIREVVDAAKEGFGDKFL